jgi:hypothetical protein
MIHVQEQAKKTLPGNSVNPVSINVLSAKGHKPAAQAHSARPVF